jgi:hypothetical protein
MLKEKYIYPEQDRVIVIGDIHGDFKALLLTLLKSKIIDNKFNWIGKNTFVV